MKKATRTGAGKAQREERHDEQELHTSVSRLDSIYKRSGHRGAQVWM